MAFSLFIGFIGYRYETSKPKSDGGPRIAELEQKIESLNGELKKREESIARFRQREKEYLQNFEAGRTAMKALVSGNPLLFG